MRSRAGQPDPLRAACGEVCIASRSERPADVSRVVRAVIVPSLLEMLLEEINSHRGGEA
jgi:hypothetical protein